MSRTVFLSYARDDDEPFVARLHADLTARRFDVWWDRDFMPARGLTFLHEIRDAIDAGHRMTKSECRMSNEARNPNSNPERRNFSLGLRASAFLGRMSRAKSTLAAAVGGTWVGWPELAAPTAALSAANSVAPDVSVQINDWRKSRMV